MNIEERKDRLYWAVSRAVCETHSCHRVGGFDLPTKTAWVCWEESGAMSHINLQTGQPAYEECFAQVRGFSFGLAEVAEEVNVRYRWNYHILPTGQPAYDQRFEHVGRFFEGLADVQDESGCFHITTDGQPAYDKRFISVGHFSCGVAKARDKTGCFHVLPNGKSLYAARNFVDVGPFTLSGEAIAWVIFQFKEKDGRKKRVLMKTKIDRRGRVLKKRKGFKVVRPTFTDIENHRRKAY